MPDLNILQVDLFLPVSRIEIVLLGGNQNEEINPEIKNTQMGYQDQGIRDNGYPSQTVPALTNRLIKCVVF